MSNVNDKLFNGASNIVGFEACSSYTVTQSPTSPVNGPIFVVKSDNNLYQTNNGAQSG